MIDNKVDIMNMPPEIANIPAEMLSNPPTVISSDSERSPPVTY